MPVSEEFETLKKQLEENATLREEIDERKKLVEEAKERGDIVAIADLKSLPTSVVEKGLLVLAREIKRLSDDPPT